MDSAPGPNRRVGPQVVIFLLVLGVAAAMAIEPTRRLLEQRSRIDAMTDDLRRVRRENRRLSAQIRRLNDPDYVEQQARDQIGLVRPGETTYVVMPPSRRARTDRRARDVKRDTADTTSPQDLFQAFLHFVGLL